MRRTRVVAASGAACLMIVLTAAPASAQQPESTPGGPWAQPNQNESLAAIRDYDELVSTLERLVARSHGAAELTYSPFRAKGSGRAIPIVTIGSGDRGIVIIANQHGDEFTVSNSALELVRALTSNAAGAQEIRDAVTVTIIPRVNIDGFDATPIGEPWRHNVDPFCTIAPCPAFYALGRGYDINRYHSYLVSDPHDDPNTGPVARRPGRQPGARVAGGPQRLRRRRRRDGVDVVLDLHHQGSKPTPTGQMVTGSTLWPNATATADALGIRPQFDQDVLTSKQVVSTLVRRTTAGTRTSRATAARRRRHLAQRLRPARLRVGADRDARRHRPEVQRLHRQDGVRRRGLRGRGAGRRQPVAGRRQRAEALRLTPGETGCPPADEGDE